MGKDEAKFILKEIKSKKMYIKKREQYMDEFQLLRAKLYKLYGPKCPQSANGEKCARTKSKEQVFLEILEEKDRAEKMFLHYNERLKIVQELEAIAFYEDDGFAKDFFRCSDQSSDMNYNKLEKKYNVSNAYSTMLGRICKNSKCFSKLK